MSRLCDEMDPLYTAICSNATIFAKTKGFFYDITENLMTIANKDEWLEKALSTKTDEAAKITAIEENTEFTEALKEVLGRIQPLYREKNFKLSCEKMSEAHLAFERNDLAQALALCNQVVITVPSSSDDFMDNKVSLALALWFRSEVLMKMKRYDLALRDLKLSLKKGLSVKIRAQYYRRLGDAYKGTGNMNGAKVSYELSCRLYGKNEEVKAAIQKEIDSLKVIVPKFESEKSEKVNKIKITAGAKENMPALSKLVKIVEKENFGRFAVADTNIKTGDVLLKESPYAACLVQEFYGTHCLNCFKRLEAPISCPKCSGVAFCDIDCQEYALNTYHRYECSFTSLLLGSGMSVLSHVGLRMITQIGLDDCRTIYAECFTKELKSLNTTFLNNIEGSIKNTKRRSRKDRLNRNKRDETGQIILNANDDNTAEIANVPIKEKMDDKTGALRIYSLCTHSENRTSEDFLKRYIMSMFLRHCLKKSDFFSDKESFINDETIVLELLLRNLQLLQFNAHEIYETLRGSHRFSGSKPNYIAVGIYPTGALFNHECYPAVARYFDGKDIVLRTTRPLSNGEVIAENYGPHFLTKSLKERQKELSCRYWFKCQCIACIEDWSDLKAMKFNTSPRLRCVTVGCNYKFSEQSLPEKCPKCTNPLDADLVKNNKIVLKESLELYQEGAKLMEEQNVESALKALTRGLDLFHEVAFPPHKETHLAQEALRYCYADHGNVHIVSCEQYRPKK